MSTEVSKDNWTQEEDDLLIDLRNIRRIGTWVEIAAHFKNKNPKQCAYRFKKLGSGPNKDKWTREEELKLFQLVDLYGERFEFIKSFFNSKSEEEIRSRYYKNSMQHCINFGPDEDAEILKMYYNSELNSIAQRIVLLKGTENVRRRLQLLLKNKGEEFHHNFDINSLIPMKLECIYKNDTLISDRSNKETTICSNSIFTDLNENSLTNEKPQISGNISFANQSTIEEHLKLSLNEEDLQDDAFSSGIYHPYANYNKREKRLSSQCLSRCHSDIDFNEFNVLQERSKPTDMENNLFEATFLSTFSKEFTHSDNEFMCEVDLYSNQALNVESLLVKKKSLESVLSQITTISNHFNEGINEKIKICKLKEKDKTTVNDLLTKTLSKEKELVQSLSAVSLRLEERLHESNYNKDLMLAINLLGSLIQTNKLKMKLVSKVMEKM